MFPGSALKKAADPSLNNYYRFSFAPRKNALNTNGTDVFAL